MEYVPVKTATIWSDTTLGFDLYIKISEKYLLYIRSEDEIERVRLHNLHMKGCRVLFINKADKSKYDAFINQSAETALSSPEMPTEKKADIINGQTKGKLEEMFEEPEKKESYDATQAAAANHVALLLKEPQALEHMLKVASSDKTTYQHSVNVATIATGLAVFLGAPEEVCKAVGLGGLLHDIGKSQNEKYMGKTLEQVEEGDMDDYKQHPRVGAGFLQGKDYVSKDVLDMIVLHEERLDGGGYPAGLKKLDQIFQLIGLANMYDRQVTFQGKKPQEAYESIKAMDPAPYDARLIEGLEKVLKNNKIYE